MDYLGHNEFGLNHKPWNKPKIYHNFNDINYWLEQWCLFYKNILNKYKYHNKCIFIIYEELTNINYLKILLKKINVNQDKILNLNYFKNSNKQKIDNFHAESIYDEAQYIYNDFRHLLF